MAELVDARDLKSLDQKSCGFDSRLAHQSCKENNIDYQYFYNMEQTDAAWIHKLFSGCPTLSVCICARGIHTASTMIDLHDYDCAKEAAYKVLSELNEEKIEAFKASNR